MSSELIIFTISIIGLLVAIAAFFLGTNHKPIRYFFGSIFLLIAITFAILGFMSLYQDSPFVGVWSGVDTDGSDLTLSITKSSGEYTLDLFDTTAWLCDLDETGNPQYSVKVVSTGVVSSGVLKTNTVSATCSNNSSSSFNPKMDVEYRYNKSDDTLIDSFGIIWKRR